MTPFSPRALDRGLAGTLVALARQGHAPMTPPLGAHAILAERPHLDFVVETLAERARDACGPDARGGRGPAPAGAERALDLLDEWSRIAMDLKNIGGGLQYQTEAGAAAAAAA